MSGPKVSVYELSAAQKKRYYEQLEIVKQTEQCIQQVTRTLKVLETELQRASDAAKDGQAKCDSLGRQIELKDITERIKEIRDLIGEMTAEYNAIQEAYRKDKAGVIMLSPDMNAQREAKLNALRRLIGTIGNSIKESKELKDEVLRRIEEVDENMRTELHAQLLGGFSIDFSTLKKQGMKKKAEEQSSDEDERESDDEKRIKYTRKINDSLAKVLDLIISPDRLSKELKKQWEQIQKLAREISSPDYLENFYAITVLPFTKECMQYAFLMDQFEALYDRYSLLCEESGETAKEFECSKESLELIGTEIERLEGCLDQEAERSYIDEMLEEAMEEMGYDLIGRRETVKKSGRRVKHELYHFGDGTGVDVTYGENGQITMELGGFDTEDRMPDVSETERLIEDMHRFCGEYSALERVLEEKGIKRRNVSLMPPSADFAQIINTEDYELVRPVTEFAVKKDKKDANKAKHAE